MQISSQLNINLVFIMILRCAAGAAALTETWDRTFKVRLLDDATWSGNLDFSDLQGLDEMLDAAAAVQIN